MADLKLTLLQAKRLFDLPLELCESALRTLVSVGFLMQTRDGSFLRRSEQPSVEPLIPPTASDALRAAALTGPGRD